jgi:hypothetical protein
MCPVVLQVSLSQVFVGMRQAQHQHLFVVLDWGVANAKLEEVMQALPILRPFAEQVLQSISFCECHNRKELYASKWAGCRLLQGTRGM